MIRDLKPYPAYKDSGVPWLGKVPEHWLIERLKSVMSNIIQMTRELQNGESYVALEHVESWTGRLRQAAPEVFFDSQVKRFQSGDVLFGKLRPYLAKVTRLASDGVCVGEFFVLRPCVSNVTAPYIEQLLRSKPVIDVINSSTFGAKMPRVDWQFMGGMMIPLPPVPEQIAIVRSLDHIDRRIRHSINAKQKLIKLLEEQKQAVIHQAVTRGLDPNVRLKPSGVEWLGEVPAGWEVKRLKHISTVNDDTLSENTPPDYRLLYVDISNVDPIEGIQNVEEMTFENSPSRARRIVQSGDVIVSTVRTYLKAITPIIDPPENLIVSTGFAVIRANSNFDSKFAGYTLRGSHFIESVVARSNGVSYPAINASELVSLKTPLPPLPEQQTIAAFLDRETARLDALIAKKQRFIELLEEKRQAVITHAVTRGLDPDVEMKDSGVEWIGEVPIHWEVLRAKCLFHEINERSESGEEELLTVSHITGVTPRSEKDVNMFMAESLEGYKKCRIGDLVINTMWAWMGALGVAKGDGIVSPSYNVYRGIQNDYYPEYYDNLLRTPNFKVEIIRHSKGIWSSRWRLYPDEFTQILLPLPPLDEQKQIAEGIERERIWVDSYIRKTNQQIEKLHEYRTALISAAVTGKIDIRDEGVIA